MEAIKTIDLTKRFSYLNPPPGASTSTMWLDYVFGFFRHKRKNSLSILRQETLAVNCVSLSISVGEIFGLLGPNGAGKTTFVKLLSGILAPSSGTAKINGYDIIKQSKFAKASVNVVQSAGWLGFDQQLSIKGNLEFWAKLYGLSRKKSRERIQDVLEIVGLSDKAESSPGVLSSGMRQRLAIAKGILVHAPVFLLDEPTVGLDPNIAYMIRDYIREDLNRKMGQTILLTTHNMLEAEQMCTRIGILNEGRLLACDTVHALKALARHKVAILPTNSTSQGVIDALKRDRFIKTCLILGRKRDNIIWRIYLQNNKSVRDMNVFLANQGYPRLAVEESKPTLEDVFVLLTGKELPDETSEIDTTQKELTEHTK